MDLFSKYGKVQQIKMKKPNSNVPLNDISSLPCSAYVNFATEEAAQSAASELNGKFIQGSLRNLRIEPYQRANRFFGALMGLNRNELLSNTHFRVLFIKNIYKHVSRENIK